MVIRALVANGLLITYCEKERFEQDALLLFPVLNETVYTDSCIVLDGQ